MWVKRLNLHIRNLQLKSKSKKNAKYLNKLIEEQNFEEAAVIRDEIKALKDESEVSRHE